MNPEQTTNTDKTKENCQCVGRDTCCFGPPFATKQEEIRLKEAARAQGWVEAHESEEQAQARIVADFDGLCRLETSESTEK